MNPRASGSVKPPALIAPDGRPVVTMYTDGSYQNQYARGGYAALLIYGTQSMVVYGGGTASQMASQYTPYGPVKISNNRMELAAVIEGLKCLTVPCEVHIYSDSQYVVNAIAGWLLGWRNNNWRTTSTGRPVENQDLWEQYLLTATPHRVITHWVRGHNGHPENELVDYFAGRFVSPAYAKRMQQGY